MCLIIQVVISVLILFKKKLQKYKDGANRETGTTRYLDPVNVLVVWNPITKLSACLRMLSRPTIHYGAKTENTIDECRDGSVSLWLMDIGHNTTLVMLKEGDVASAEPVERKDGI